MSETPKAALPSTSWTLVRSAAFGQQAEAKAALERLARVYRPAVKQFYEQATGDPAEAEQLCNQFLASLNQNGLSKLGTAGVDAEYLDFRSWLFAQLSSFLTEHGSPAELGSTPHGAQTAAPSYELSRAACSYEQAWALSLLAEARRRLSEEAASLGRVSLYEALAPLLSSEPLLGDYRRLSEVHGISPSTLRLKLARLRQRLQELIRQEVTESLDLREEARLRVEAELVSLRQALTGQYGDGERPATRSGSALPERRRAGVK